MMYSNAIVGITIFCSSKVKGTSETISRILQPYNIRVAHKPTTTLRHLLINVKDRDEPSNRQGAVYKIKCSDCQASYIGETGRNLNTRLTEHKRATSYIFQLEPTTPNMSQHIATRWSNAHNMLGPTMLRHVVLTCCDRLARVLELSS